MSKTKEQIKEEWHGQQGGSIHRPTQGHNSTQKQCSYFYHWKTKKTIWYNASKKQKIREIRVLGNSLEI